MGRELGIGQHIVCQGCPARTGSTPESYGCDTSKLDGVSKRQPHVCPLPRISFEGRPKRIDPYEILKKQLRG